MEVWVVGEWGFGRVDGFVPLIFNRAPPDAEEHYLLPLPRPNSLAMMDETTTALHQSGMSIPRAMKKMVAMTTATEIIPAIHSIDIKCSFIRAPPSHFLAVLRLPLYFPLGIETNLLAVAFHLGHLGYHISIRLRPALAPHVGDATRLYELATHHTHG